MKLDVRYASHPEDAKKYTTEELRAHYLIGTVFEPDAIRFTYSHVDRIIAGGVMPVQNEVAIETAKDLGVGYFLERREMGVINVGGAGEVELDGTFYRLGNRDGLYIGMGIRDVKFRSLDASHPAKFYINSAPAHHSYPVVKIEIEKANPVRLGSAETLNQRTIYQYVHPAVCQSCQLVMGLTMLEPGSVWNTMPTHTHERRMEVYFYFDMAPDARVFHLMGQPGETRHIVMENEQAVISPSWSIHSGVGTGRYTFIWGMAGENQTFDDMDHVPMSALR